MGCRFESCTRSLAFIGLAVLILAAPAQPQSSPTPWYSVQDLHPVVPQRINNAGEIAGYEYTPRPNGVLGPEARVYRNGSWVAIGDLPDPAPDNGFNSYSPLTGINDRGEAVGQSFKLLSGDEPYDTLHRGAIVGRDDLVLTELPLEPDVYPVAINDARRVVGSRDRYLDLYPDYDRAFAFDLADGNDIDLDVLLPWPREDSYAKDVNRGGDVAGYAWSTTPGLHWRAFLYREQTSQLELLEGPDGSYVTWALAINDRRQIAGQGFLAGVGSRQAVLFDADSGTVSGLPMGPDAPFSQANDINSFGDAVGQMNVRSSGDRAFLYRNGVLHDLNELIPAGTGWILRDAVSINDKRQIIGRGNPPGPPGQIGYFLLTLTPQHDTAELIDVIQGLVSSGVLGVGNGNSLIKKLEGAIQQLDNGNVGPAVNKLEAFINEVEAFIRSGKLTAEAGQFLINEARRIIGVITS